MTPNERRLWLEMSHEDREEELEWRMIASPEDLKRASGLTDLWYAQATEAEKFSETVKALVGARFAE